MSHVTIASWYSCSALQPLTGQRLQGRHEPARGGRASRGKENKTAEVKGTAAATGQAVANGSIKPASGVVALRTTRSGRNTTLPVHLKGSTAEPAAVVVAPAQTPPTSEESEYARVYKEQQQRKTAQRLKRKQEVEGDMQVQGKVEEQREIQVEQVGGQQKKGQSRGKRHKGGADKSEGEISSGSTTDAGSEGQIPSSDSDGDYDDPVLEQPDFEES